MVTFENKRVRRYATKSRSGCLTCKARHVRCDEQKPKCHTCERIGIRCLGYNQPEPWIIWSADQDKSEAHGMTDTGTTTEKGRDQMSRSPMPHGSRISQSLQCIADEPTIISEAYGSLSPPAKDKDKDYGQLPEHVYCFRADDGTVPWLVVTPARAHSGIVHQSYLALAASTLVLFRPERYSIRLHFKYLHLTVAEIRKSITQGQADLYDLLYAIAHTLVASAIHHDVGPSRAHLAAAASILSQVGGIEAIDPLVAGLLRYADFYLASIMLCSHYFPLAGIFQDTSNAQAEKHATVDTILTHLATRLRSDATATSSMLPPVVIEALHLFSDTVLNLASTTRQAPNVTDLGVVSVHIGVMVSLVLRHRPSVIAKDGNCTKSPPRAAPPPPRGFPGKQQQQHQWQQDQSRPSLDDWTVLLLMWSQILHCCTNAPLGAVSIRTAVLPLLPRLGDGSTDGTRAGLSRLVQRGVNAWNERATRAQQTTKALDRETDDWPSLVDIVASMERDFPVRLAPLMRRLLVVCPARGALGVGRRGRRRWDIVDASGRIGKTLHVQVR